jgi:hypothetical protein
LRTAATLPVCLSWRIALGKALRGRAQAQRDGYAAIVIHIAPQKAARPRWFVFDWRRGYHNLANCHT